MRVIDNIKIINLLMVIINITENNKFYESNKIFYLF